MAGYTHICSECGATLRIGEEHLGRRLRCGSCRTEFTARSPAGEPPASAESPPQPNTLTMPCLACGTVLTLREEHLGRKLRCPRCGHEFLPEASDERRPVPSASAGAAPAAPQSAGEQPVGGAGGSIGPDPTAETGGGGASESQPAGSEAIGESIPAPGPPPDRPPPPASVPRSYTHACDACGAELQVHERYYGKKLRCTSCRAEFEADPHGPSAVADRSAASDPGLRGDAGGAGGFRFRRWMGTVGLLVLIIAAALWWLGGDRGSGFGNEAFRVKKSKADLGILGNGGEPRVTVALDRETVDELIAALRANDPAALRQLRESPRCLQLDAGTGVRVLERRKRSSATRVRILNGPWSSRIVWVPVQWIE